MKVLLTGGSGQVGQEIFKSKPNGVEVFNPSRNDLDLSDYQACKRSQKIINLTGLLIAEPTLKLMRQRKILKFPTT